jgi:ribose/xylose/arabinose/galactoside ABC-type transport system permease subunit
MKIEFKDRRLVLGILIFISTILMSIISPYFLTRSNLLELLQYSTIVGLLALAQTLIIIGGSGGIDLSVASNLSFSSVIFGVSAVHFGLDPWIASVIAIAFGGLLGAINGVFIAYLNLPPLIVTLATMYLYSSVALGSARGSDFNGFDKSHFSFLGQGSILGIPTQVILVLLPIYFVLSLIMNRTLFGSYIYAIGSSAEAAKLTGINVDGMRFSLYAISGVLAGVGSVVTSSWLMNARPVAGSFLLLPSITVAVLGGIVITGGIGRISGTFLALLLVAILSSGMQLANINNTFQVGLLGIVLIISILLRPRNQSKILVL